MQKFFIQTKAFSKRILKALENYGRKGLGVLTLCSLLASSPVFAGIPLKQGDGAVNDAQVNAAIEVYNRIPASIRLQYELNHNSITFFNSKQRRDNVIGMYTALDGMEANIMLSDQDLLGAYALAHEIGHYFDDVVYKDEEILLQEKRYGNQVFRYVTRGKRSRSEEADFVAIYQQEANQNGLVTQYEKSDSTEYFAGSFKAYVDTPEHLQVVAPATYAFIDQLVTEFNASHPVPEEAVTA